MKRAPFVLVAVCVLAGALAAVAAGPALASNAGWTAHQAASAPLLSVAATDPAHAWAVGPGPTIVATSNGGASWTAQHPATSHDLYGVAFSDSLDGWAVGPKGTVVATTDGGAVWSAQAAPTTNATLVGVAARGRDCWAVGADDASGGGVIVATTDGGAAWSAQSTLGADALYSVTFADADHGWAVGDHGTIMATTDGGAVWTRQRAPTSDYLNGVTSCGALRAWAVGESGVIVATSDGGVHWNVVRRSAAKAPDLYTVAFADKRHGWAVGVGGVILATTDGGLTWRAQGCPTRHDLAAVAFADVHHGFVAGTTGTMLTSTRGGWSDVRRPTTVAAGTVEGPGGVRSAATGAGATWQSRSVRVVLTASDGPGGSGVAAVQYSLDRGKTWTSGTTFARSLSFTVAAPADHSGDGVHAFLYRAIDNAGNVEAARRGRVLIDTRRPTPVALWPAAAIRGQPVVLRFFISDPRPGSATATVTIRIRNVHGKLVKRLAAAVVKVERTQRCVVAGRLPRGAYRFTVAATDAAGNRGSTVASNRLVVRDRPVGFAGPLVR